MTKFGLFGLQRSRETLQGQKRKKTIKLAAKIFLGPSEGGLIWQTFQNLHMFLIFSQLCKLATQTIYDHKDDGMVCSINVC